MNLGEIYVKYVTLPNELAIETFNNFENRINWKDNCRILDVGCGPGNVTHDFILPTLPKSTKEIIGIDISTDFIKYANLHYGNNPILSYKVMDIVNGEVPREYEGYFDYTISAFSFQQIYNQKAAFQNIKTMLKPGGEMICYFPTTTNTFDVYNVLSKQEKWKRYLHDYALNCSPYKDSHNVESEIGSFLSDMGFKIHYLNFERRRAKFLNKNFYYTLRALAYENFKMPDNLFDEFLQDFMEAMRSLKLIKIDEDNEEYYDCSYKLITFYIVKET
ncbi:hypothetical protein RI129_008847 [Pyrocoelia pectoralis]|uniref:Methyltransferase domain-containing protein n=1 Tax=Pyrocoelia pectoralis TaxID=417401 RepID=A0AAN7ZE30_9COLE